MRPVDRQANRLRVVVVGGFVGFVGVALGLSGGYVVDDAYIVFRVVRRVAAGHPWAFQGDVAVDGVTSPLWGGLLFLCTPLGPLPSVARALGSLCAVAGGALALFHASGPPKALRARVGAALFLAVQLPLLAWAGAGLETGLTTLVLTVATRGLYAKAPVLDGAARGFSAAWVLALFAIPFLRPELVPVAAFAALHPMARRRVSTLRAWGLAGVVGGTAGVVLWRLVTFGHALPLAALAKPSDPLAGAAYVARWLVGTGLLTACAVVVGAWLRARGRAGLGAALSSCGPVRLPAAIALGLLCVALAGGDWMPGGRLLVPLLPMMALVVGRGLARVPGKWAGGLGLVMTLVVPVALCVLSLPTLRAQPGVRERGAAEVLEALDGASRVALVDIGYLGYAGDLEVVDLGGITDLEIARLPGGHLSKRIPEALLMARGVDAIVLHSRTPARVVPDGTERAPATGQGSSAASHATESGTGGRLVGLAGYPVELLVARMPFVQEQFRVRAQVAYAPDYHYVVLRRVPTDTPR